MHARVQRNFGARRRVSGCGASSHKGPQTDSESARLYLQPVLSGMKYDPHQLAYHRNFQGLQAVKRDRRGNCGAIIAAMLLAARPRGGCEGGRSPQPVRRPHDAVGAVLPISK